MVKQNLAKLKDKIKELWEYRIFRYTILIHGGYFIVSIILTLFLYREQNDFLVYYEVGEVVLRDINDIYTETYRWPYRYFPLSALYFVPFYLMGFDLGFIIFNLINLILNILICIYLFKIIDLVKGRDHEKDNKRVVLYICLYMISLPQIFNYILGQVNLYVTLSIVIKPITIFMIPFLLVLQFDLKSKKFKFDLWKSVTRMVGVILPLSLNLVLFIIFPRLLQGFIATNFTSTEPSQPNHSFSITKLIINLLFSTGLTDDQVLSIQLPIFLIVLIFFAVIGLIAFTIRKNIPHSIIYGYSFGILIMLICYYDSWDHHLLNLTPLLLIALFNFPRQSEITKKFIKPSFLFLSFLDLAFMGLYRVLINVFPFNFASTIFLILVFYGLIKYIIFKNDYNRPN
ncbi:MAG: hypothetical protein ACXAB8_09250 [Promethearchaeota archaeon]|jgi:hypothetical protein